MSAKGTTAGTTEVSRAQFLSLLVRRLGYRWLGDPSIVSEAISDLFDRKHVQREQLVSDLVVQHRTIGPISSDNLLPWLRRHRVIRRLFKDRATIALPVKIARERNIACDWSVPAISNEQELADWLSLSSPAILDWLTLPHHRRSTDVEHYIRQSRRKRDGTLRWIEAPRPVLKRVQRRLQSDLIDRIPLHEAAHGFRRGRSIATSAGPHVGKRVLLRMDLQNFFASIRTWRVRSLMIVAGYSRPVATTIAQLCTAPPVNGFDDDAVLRRSRLPQGAPTSPGLANVAAFRLDRRLSGLSDALDVCYTRYADDLIFSGDESFAQRTKRFETSAAAIAMDEGFRVNFRKTRTMRCGNRQQVLGLIVNDHLSTPRGEYEILKAILTNSIRYGPESQNRDEHPKFRESLRGRIAHIAGVHAGRGVRLLRLFGQIDWSAER